MKKDDYFYTTLVFLMLFFGIAFYYWWLFKAPCSWIMERIPARCIKYWSEN